jgi:23S rRNA pseudouridine2605 synthase
LRKGATVEGIAYGPMEAALDREQGSNVWLTVGLREGKNREVRKVLGSIGLEVNRLIRISYGPFQLSEMKEGAVEEVKTAILREQISGQLAKDSGADFDAPLRDEMAAAKAEPQGKRPSHKPERKTLSLHAKRKGKFHEPDMNEKDARFQRKDKFERRGKRNDSASAENERGPHRRKQGRGDRPGPRGRKR